ncbi:ATP-binding protein [Paenibacillus hexagrammi]|uniref:histidine kinase n=1 Tax=Paenibacillus hexagrammi TaxID=2908839 RepID=A0ABY3SEK3_9BACL|nr:sensor histidine kinase [Paenibacillus sp. YPD9-1]UJF32423.1 sensor histidine kinase [Paenibacillus sp. YPD9-1]
MVKDLFFQIIVALIPILIAHYSLTTLKLPNTFWLYGPLAGIAIIVCVSMPVNFNGFLWDLRSALLVTCFLYAGPRAGLIAAFMMVAYRLALGGPMLYLIVTSAVMQSFPPFILHQRFIKSEPKKRIRMVFFLSLVSFSILFFHLYIYTSASGETPFSHLSPWHYLLFGIIHVSAMLISSILIENIIEMYQLRKERSRTEKLAVLSELAASVAHEIRNPLTVVRGFLQLTQQSLDEKNKSFISTAILELDRAEKIISDYLSFAKPQIEHISVIQVEELVNSTTDVIRAYASMRGVEMHTLPYPESLQVASDKHKLQQVLMNLIKNAIEAVPEHKEDGRVEVRISIERNFVKIEVADNGKGMTPEQVTRLGDPYYSTKDTGTGLGLMVTFRLVEAMDGKLIFHSKPGKGTQAVLYIPLFEKNKP